MLSEKDIHWLYVYHSKRPKKKNKKYTSSFILSLRAMFRAGMISKEISKLMDTPKTQISRCLEEGDKEEHRKNNPFKTSKAKLIRDSEEYKQWRSSVFQRDRWTCRICSQMGKDLHAHHIKSFAKHPELRFNIDNGSTLCVPCHKKQHRKAKKVA